MKKAQLTTDHLTIFLNILKYNEKEKCESKKATDVFRILSNIYDFSRKLFSQKTLF